jgi:hypothetical protein
MLAGGEAKDGQYLRSAGVEKFAQPWAPTLAGLEK